LIPASRATGRLGLLDRELMERMGHSNTRAAMVLPARHPQPRQAIAKALGELASKARNE
jgi:hypothetical protein